MSHNLNKFTLPIKGMHCRSCELLVEEGLSKIHHVKNRSKLQDWQSRYLLFY